MDTVSRRKKIILLFTILVLSGYGRHDLFAVKSPPGEVSAGKVAVFQRLGNYVPLGLTFTDDRGKEVVLRNMVDRPTVISLVYLSCKHACPMLLFGLAELLGETDLKAGEDFNVITVSFDENDTPAVAAERKKGYLQSIGKPFPEDEWPFLTGKRETIKTLTDSVGFSFKREENGMFTHPVTLVVLSKEGRVIRYLSGTTFLPFDLNMAVLEASEGRIGSIVKRAMLYCFSYDPAGKKYVLDILKLVGIVTILCAASFVTFLVVTGKKYRNRTR